MVELGALSVDALVPQTDDERRRAADKVREMCTQHVCTTDPCQDRNHRRDVDYARHCLEALGLTDVSEGAGAEEGDNCMTVPRQVPS